MIRTQMNADFQDSIKTGMLFRVYLRKPASLETKRVFIIYLSNSIAGFYWKIIVRGDGRCQEKTVDR